MRVLARFPAFSILLIAAGALMLVPALHAAHLGDWRIARTFFYHGVFFSILAVILGLALMNRTPERAERYQLVTLLMAYLLLPVALAMPLLQLQPVGFSAAYFEMLSSLTTTGATIFDRHWLVPPPVHLWRALVGWAGGLMILIAAFAVLAPLNLGGFEIVSAARGEGDLRRSLPIPAARERIVRSVLVIAPVYAFFTGLLAILLMIAGDRPFVAFCHAMSTLSTSGISPIGGPAVARGGFFSEMLIAVFLLAAVSHRVLTARFSRARRSLRDPEFQLMLISVLGVTVVLFLRAFVGAIEADRQANLLAAAQAVWGGLFTVLSHLTTAGFESRYWLTMQIWSRLEAPGIILLGVAVMGGGIATTAGGVKLLRLYALYRHGLREMDRLVHPSSPGRRGRSGNGLIAEAGTRIAFIFLMLFLTTLALVMMALAASGLAFERSLTLAVAALTTTGPLIATLEDGTTYRELPDLARWILCAAMVVGRMEALVIIALFNPSYWRR